MKISGKLHAHQVRVAQKLLPKTKISYWLIFSVDLSLADFLCENSFESVVRARQETHFPASSKTVRRRMRLNELRNRAVTRKIYLTDANKKQRLKFAMQFVNQPLNMWETVVFSHEKTFQSRSNGQIRVYRPAGTRYEEQYAHRSNQSGRFSINFWGWRMFSRLGSLKCNSVPQNFWRSKLP